MQRILNARMCTLSIATLSLVLAGGGAAVAQDDAPVTLQLAVADQSDRPSYAFVEAFVDAVEEISGGAIQVEPSFEAAGSDFEIGTAKLLLDGESDLAVAASRAWDEVGVSSFRALQAPFLIDNDALAVAVAESDVARTMLESMEASGVVGLELWPEDLRHPATLPACTTPIVAPEDLEGLDIRAIASGVTYDLLDTMGAIPSMENFDPSCARQGTESGLRQGKSLPAGVVFTGDITLFPKFQVLAVNAATFERLSERQRDVIREAAGAAQDMAIATHPSEADAAHEWCSDGGAVVLAGDDGIAAFQAAAQPVFDRLMTDPIAAESIVAIGAMKQTVVRSPGATECGVGTVATASVGPDEPGSATSQVPADGTWRIEVTPDSLEATGLTEGEILNVAAQYSWTFDSSGDGRSGTFELAVRSGTFDDFECHGTYELDDGSLLMRFVTIPNCGGAEARWMWSEDAERVGHVQVLDTPGWDVTIERAMWQSAPFIQTASAGMPVATAAPLQSRFPLPDLTGFSGDLPPEGSYRYSATEEALLAGGADPGYARQNVEVVTWTLNDGKVVAEVTNSSGSFECAADMTRLGGERVRFTAYGWCDATYDFVWRLDGDVLYSVTVDSAALDSWTNQDWLNRQAWNKIPHVRID